MNILPKKTNSQRNLWFSLLPIIIGSIFLFTLNSIIPFLPGDDFIYHFKFTGDGLGERINTLGEVFTSQYYHYQIRNGRFLSHGLEQFFTLLGKPIFNYFNTLMVVLLAYFMVGIAKQDHLYEKDIPFISLTFIAIILFNPEFGECFLWYSGSFNYLWTTTIVFGILYYFFLFLNRQKNNYTNSIISLMSFFVLGVILGSTNENTVLGVMTLIILLGGYITLYRKDNLPWSLVLLLVGILIGFLLMLLSPGNQNRLEATEVANINYYAYLISFFTRAFKYVTFYYSGAWLILGLFLVFVYNTKSSKSLKLIFPLLFLMTSLTTNLVMIVTKGYYPTRVTVVGYLFLLVAILALAYSLKPEKEIFKNLSTKVNKLTYLVLFPLLVIYFLYAFDYYKEVNLLNKKREAAIIDAKKNDRAFVTFETYPSKSGPAFFIRDVSIEKNYFANKIAAKYYDIDSIIVISNERLNQE